MPALDKHSSGMMVEKKNTEKVCILLELDRYISFYIGSYNYSFSYFSSSFALFFIICTSKDFVIIGKLNFYFCKKGAGVFFSSSFMKTTAKMLYFALHNRVLLYTCAHAHGLEPLDFYNLVRVFVETSSRRRSRRRRQAPLSTSSNILLVYVRWKISNFHRALTEFNISHALIFGFLFLNAHIIFNILQHLMKMTQIKVRTNIYISR